MIMGIYRGLVQSSMDNIIKQVITWMHSWMKKETHQSPSTHCQTWSFLVSSSFPAHTPTRDKNSTETIKKTEKSHK